MRSMCSTATPTIQELKTTYGDRVAFVVRYMPLHVSSMNAALAAEAAGAQGNYVEMHDLLFERQDEWGHQQTPERDLFFTYAAELASPCAASSRSDLTGEPDEGFVELVEELTQPFRGVAVGIDTDEHHSHLVGHLWRHRPQSTCQRREADRQTHPDSSPVEPNISSVTRPDAPSARSKESPAVSSSVIDGID